VGDQRYPVPDIEQLAQILIGVGPNRHRATLPTPTYTPEHNGTDACGVSAPGRTLTVARVAPTSTLVLPVLLCVGHSGECPNNAARSRALRRGARLILV
jgi:hypothetical protein